jgi:hypothetical protein
MKKKMSFFIFIISSFLLWGCYPQGPDYAEEMDVVLTNHNPDYDFATKATYAMPDKIVKITGNLVTGDSPTFIPDATAKLILARIDQNMQALGWVKVDVSKNPDMLLAPASWETTTVYMWYDYWYWWYGGYYGGWGWYGGYYPPVYYSSYTTGTLIMPMVDKSIVGSNGNPVIQWTGAITGIMTNSYDATRVNNLIDKAFTQSPYLKTN